MKLSTASYFHRGVLALLASLLTIGVSISIAGELATDGLTVYQDSTFYGGVRVIGRAGNSAIPTNGLVLYYSFNSNDSSRVTDNSGHGYTGVVNDAVWDSGGIDGGCFSFDGDDDYINTTQDTVPLVSGGQFTVSVWVSLVDGQYGANECIFSTVDTIVDENQVYLVAGGDGTIEWGFWADSEIYALHSEYGLSDGAAGWHHFVVVADQASENIRLYIDGIEDANSPIGYGGMDLSAYTNAYPLYLGTLFGNGSPYGEFLNGKLDEFRVYDRALTPEEIEGLYFGNAPTNALAGHLNVAVISSSASNDTISVADPTRFASGIIYQPELGDLPMGIHTNQP